MLVLENLFYANTTKALKKTFESFDADATWGPLKTAIDYGAKEFDNTTLEQILVQVSFTGFICSDICFRLLDLKS